MTRNFIMSDETGAEFSRSHRITFENPLDGNRSATCSMQLVTVSKDGTKRPTDDGLLVIQPPQNQAEFDEVVDIIDMKGNVIGTEKRGDRFNRIMVAINSEMIRADKLADKPQVILHDPV